MKELTWNPADKPPTAKTVSPEFLVATKHILIDADYDPDEDDQERRWTTGKKGMFIQGVTHWMNLPPSPQLAKLNPDELAKWHDTNKMKPRPKPGKMYFIGSEKSNHVRVLRYKAGNEWETFDGELRLHIHYWRELPPNPNSKR